MLLGTFQEMPMHNGEICAFKEVQSRYDEILKFRPVWCFPMTSLEVAIFQALSVAPNMPQCLCILDTDDFIRVDRVKHYQNILNDLSNDAPSFLAINDSVDDFHSEIIINREIMDGCLMAIIPMFGINEFSNEGLPLKDVLTMPRNLLKLDDNLGVIIRNLYHKIPGIPMTNETRELYKSSEGSIKWTNETVDMKMILEDTKYKFSVVLLPFIYKLVAENRAGTYWVYSCIPNATKIFYLFLHEFGVWANTDCSLEGYDMLLDKFKKMIITNEKVVEAVAYNELPERNDKCPCGSGKKFKNCCGKYLV